MFPPNSDVSAESSTATLEVPSDPHEYAEWRQSGKLPAAKPAPAEKKPKAEASAASRESSAAGEESTEKHAPAPEAGKEKQEQAKPRGNAETRLQEILGDLKRAGLSPAELKTFKREQQAAQQAQPKAAPEKTEKPAGLEPPKKPKPDDFDSYDKYEEARDKYYEDLADFKAQKRLDEHLQKQRMEASQREMEGKLEAARKRYGDAVDNTISTSAGAIFNDQQIPAAVKALLNDSPVLVDLLYTLGSKEEDLNAFLNLARTNPGAAIRKAVLMESLINEELAGGGKAAAGSGEPARDESGKFAKQQAPAEKVTKAPPPPKEASGRASTPTDEVESAATANDFARFRSAANRRDMARFRGQ